MTKSQLDRTLDTLVDFADLNRQALTRLAESIETGNRQLVSRIDDLAVKIGEQSQSIDRLTQSVDRTAQTVDRLAKSVDGHLKVAEQQSLNIMKLSELVATQAATVNKLLDRVAA